MALSGLYSVSIGAGYWRGKIGRKFWSKFSDFFDFSFLSSKFTSDEWKMILSL